MKIRILPSAEDDLDLIFLYHIDYSNNYAISFQQEIISFFMKNLSEYPQLGVIHNTALETRKLVFQDYNIYYKIEKKIINILHIVHGKNSLNSDLSE